MIDNYLTYIKTIRRYSSRTCELYQEVLEDYKSFSEGQIIPTTQSIRNYEIYLLDGKQNSSRTVVQHLSVLSSYCKYLIRQGKLDTNPVRIVSKPKVEKRLPIFYRESSMEEYFNSTKGVLEFGSYENALNRMIISLLFDTGMRRSELISLNDSSIDFSRKIIKIKGKGDKMREIPLTNSLCKEISLYLQKRNSLKTLDSSEYAPLLQTPKGGRLYPVFVDRAVKAELSCVPGLSAQKSPHILRHTIATELLDNGAELNTIKEMLGHSSLAATQVYTHNSIEKLKRVYNTAHPRAKNETNYGD